MSVYAYGEAVRLLERALEVQDVLDPTATVQRCDLLLALGEAMLPVHEPRRVAETVAAEAFALAEARQDSPRAARAAIQALDALWRAGPAMAEFAEWAARADRHAADGSVERVYADSYLGVHAFVMGRRAEGHVYLRRAVERAGELGDGAAYLIAAGHAVTMLNGLKDLHLVDGLAEEFQLRSHTGVRAADLALGLESVGRRLLGRAQRQAAEHVWRELDQLAEQSRDPTLGAHAAVARAMRAFLDGRLDDAASVGQLAITNANAAGYRANVEHERGAVRILAVQALAYMGRAIEDIVTTFHGPSRPELAERALVVSFLGRCDEAREICAPVCSRWELR